MSAAFDCIVVGGGLAGLAAARDLRLAGWRAVVLEARDRLGGRAWYGDNGLPAPAELGGAYIHPTQTSIWAEVERYALPLDPSPQTTSTAWRTCGVLRRGGLPVPAAELPDLERAALAWHAAAATSRDNPAALDMSVADYFETFRLGPHTLDLLSAFFGEHCSNHWSQGSMLDFAVALDETETSITSFISVATLSPQLKRGTKSLVDALSSDGVEYQLSAPVRQVIAHERSVDVVLDGATVQATTAIIAVPVNTWGDLALSPPLAGDRSRFASEGHAGRGLKVLAIVGDTPSVVDFALGVGTAFYLVLKDRAVGVRHRLVVAFGPDPTALDAHDVTAVTAALHEFMPGVEVTASTSHDWTADPWSKGTWAVRRPGQSTLTDLHGTSDGRLTFAGSDIAPHGAGTMNGAIASGRAAAATVANLLHNERNAA